MIEDLIKAHDRVRYLLEKYPQCRDSDKELWLAYNVIFNNLKENMTSYEVFRLWLKNPETPVFESLSRCRRKIQEKEPHLRGELANERKIEAENVRDWAVT